MNKMIPFQRSALIKPLKNSLLYCYLLVQREKVADKHITNTGDELSGGINIDDLERHWTLKIRSFTNDAYS